MKNTLNNLAKSVYVKSALLLTFVAFVSCNTKEKNEVSTIDTSIELEKTDEITLTENQFVSGNMEVGKITLQKFNTVVKANGVFAVPPQNQVDVSSYFAGYVKEIKLLPGEEVKKGEVLFSLENPDYIQVQQDYLEAKGRLSYLKSDYERQKELMLDEITSKKNFLKAESDYTVTLAQYQSLQKKLSLMNINSETLSGENIQSVIYVRSPMSGYATSVNATKGMFLNPSDIAVTITNTDDLHIELKIFEKDLPKVKVGQPILIRLQNDMNTVYQGKVHLVNKAINSTDRTIDIHGDLVHEEDTKLFAPGMYIEGDILTTRSEYPALPIEAIAAIDTDYYALIKVNETTFKRVVVKIGTSTNEYVQILNTDDFNENTVFLTKGIFNLITE